MDDHAREVSRHIDRASHLIEIQRPAAAITELERALSFDPQNVYALGYMSQAFLMLKDFNKALDYSNRCIAADPAEEWGFRLQANAHLGKDRRDSAYKSATRAVELNPENAEALMLLAACALSIERNEEARMLGELLRRQFPESVYGHSILGDVANNEEDYGQASEHYERVLELDPEDHHTLEALATIRSRHNQYGDSVSLLRGAMSVDPTRQSRQDHLRVSMSRFALFGHANERRRSVGGLLVLIFVVYLGLAMLVARLLESPQWMIAAVSIGLPVVMLIALPLLHARFFESQSAQLRMLYQSINRDRRRRTLLAFAVAVVCAYAIAVIVYLDSGDGSVFIVPISFLLVAFWIYMLAITLRLFTLWLSDTWSKLMHKDKPRAKQGVPLLMIAMPLTAVLSLVWFLVNDSNTAVVLLLSSTVVSAILFFKRFPVGTAVFAIVLGIVIVLIDVLRQQSYDDLTLGELGLFFLAVGVAALLLQSVQLTKRFVQRRRMKKLLGEKRLVAGD